MTMNEGMETLETMESWKRDFMAECPGSVVTAKMEFAYLDGYTDGASNLSASNARLVAAVRRLRSEVDCRIEHGADSNGHLEYVAGALDALLGAGEVA